MRHTCAQAHTHTQTRCQNFQARAPADVKINEIRSGLAQTDSIIPQNIPQNIITFEAV